MMLRLLPALRLARPAPCPSAVACVRRAASGRGGGGAADDDEELHQARAWVAQLHAETIPKTIGELSFSRSSGPGGQNVNKYASARWSLCWR